MNPSPPSYCDASIYAATQRERVRIEQLIRMQRNRSRRPGSRVRWTLRWEAEYTGIPTRWST